MLRTHKNITYKLIFSFILWFVCPGLGLSNPNGFLHSEQPIPPILQHALKLPIELSESSTYDLILPRGTPLQEIPDRISQKRQMMGLTPLIPRAHQERFSKSPCWQMTNDLVVSPLPGVITKLYAQKGQHIAAFDCVGTVEAMKMELPLVSQHSGEISHVFVSSRDLLHDGLVLFGLEPDCPIWENSPLSQDASYNDLFPWAPEDPVEEQKPERGTHKDIGEIRIVPQVDGMDASLTVPWDFIKDHATEKNTSTMNRHPKIVKSGLETIDTSWRLQISKIFSEPHFRSPEAQLRAAKDPLRPDPCIFEVNSELLEYFLLKHSVEEVHLQSVAGQQKLTQQHPRFQFFRNSRYFQETGGYIVILGILLVCIMRLSLSDPRLLKKRYLSHSRDWIKLFSSPAC